MSIGNLFKGDKVIWMVFFFLCIISMIEVFSASSFLTYKGTNFMFPIMRHGMFWLVGFVCMLVVMNLKCGYFKIATPFLILLSFFLLLFVLAFGKSENDASRWISFMGITFQPSEIAKGTMVLATAQILSMTQTPNGADRNAFKWILGVCIPMIVLIAVENLSTAVLMFATIFMMMVIGRIPGKQIGILLGCCSMIVVLAVSFVLLFGKTKEQQLQELAKQEMLAKQGDDVGQNVEKQKSGGILHRATVWRNRIYDFLENKEVAPEEVDLLNKGSQKACSNIAIANSNVVGLGPGNSVERDFLSQAFSDFIYAIIIEEMGIEGALFVALLYIIILFRAGRIANRCENSFPAFLVMGLALMLVIQALFNMCVAVGLAPITGQPLPLISRGGSSTIINCVYIGVMLCISRTAKKRSPKDADAATQMVRVAKN